MSFLDKFKKQDEKKNLGTQRKVQIVAPKTIREEREEAAVVKTQKKGAVAASVSATGGVYSHSILLKPVVSEKSAHLHAFNQYAFKVSPRSNKVSIKKAIKETYGADPLEVRIIKMKGKAVMSGRTKGQRNAYKKAIVRMPKGVTLPIYEGV
jgi:large subunit ribosomal protein L23